MIQRNSRRRQESISPEQVATVLKEYHSSGLTQSRFCREHHMPLWRLHRWLQRERQEKLSGQISEGPKLIRVALPAGAQPSGVDWSYELDWQKKQLRLGGDFDPQRVGQLLHLLGVC